MAKGRLQVEESPLHGIFFSEFDHVAGPKITYQVPPDYIAKELFDCYKSYIIPKPQLRGKLISVNASEKKIIGFPMLIDNSKYPRHQLIFNMCVVCDSKLRTVQYEPIVRKLANYLVTLELENDFLSSDAKAMLPDIMQHIMDDLNARGHCSIPINESNTIYLKVIRIHPTPPEVQDHDVPIFTQNKTPVLPSEWDLTTQQWDLTVMQILPFIDGFKHVARIAVDADVEVSLVKACIRNMIYYEVITLIPIFMYSNVYMTTQKLHQMTLDPKLREECVKYVAHQGCPPPSFQTVFVLYCLLNPGTTVKMLCIKNNPRAQGIDERKFIQFGLMKGLIRRLQKHPVFVSTESSSSVSKHKSLAKYYTNGSSYDEICCKTGLSFQELDEKIEKEPSVMVCWK